MQAPVLGHLQAQGQFTLDTNASKYGIGTVLAQLQYGEERVLAYHSQALRC